MLIRFVVSNFMSIGKECEFNMLPAPLHSHQHHVYSNTTKRIKILKGAAIYGANGAGKSNIIKAIHFLQTAVLSGDIIPNTSRLQYKLDEEVASRPTVFDIEFEWHRKFYGYHLEIQKDIIVEESLYELGFKNDDKLLFERRFSEHNQKICVELGGTKVLSSRNRLLETLLAENILDNTAVHPESYNIIDRIAKDLNCSVSQLVEDKELQKKIDLMRYVDDRIGLPTLNDIMSELEKPGRDPRSVIKVMNFDESVKTIADVKSGMVLNGIVNNITDFGVFVDIGVKESGLVHISQLCDHYISSPSEVVTIHNSI